MSCKRKTINYTHEGQERKREKPCRTKEKKPTLHSVEGQLSSMSHHLCTSPAGFFLELCTEKKVVHVFVCKKDQLCWEIAFSVGQSYGIQRLKLVLMKVKSETFQIYVTTDESQWQQIQNLENPVSPYIQEEFSNLRGLVSDVDDDLGIYCLNSKVYVIASTLFHFANVPTPRVGDTIILYNVHRIVENGDVQLAVMCAKSYLKIIHHSTSTQKSCNIDKNNEPNSILEIIKKCAWGYRNIYWIHRAYSILTKSFSDEFISSIGLPSEGGNTFRKDILHMLVQYVSSKVPQPDKNSEQRSLVLENLSLRHVCSPMKPEVMPFTLWNVEQLLSSNSRSTENPENIWSQSSTHNGDLGRLLIAVLSVRFFRFILKDATGSMYCVVRNNDSEDSLIRDLANLNGNVVLVSQYTLIRETFAEQLDKNVQKVPDLVYLHTLTNHLDLLITLGNAGLVAGQGNHANCVETEEVRTSLSSKVCDVEKLHENMVPMQLTRSNHNPLQEYWSQLIFIHHKSSVFVRDCGKPPRCLLLVTLLGDMKKITKEPSRTKSLDCKENENPRHNVLFVTLQCPSLNAYPLITNNVVHELRLPLTCSGNIFHLREELVDLRSLIRYLPTVKGVLLPAKTEVHYAGCRLFNSINTIYIDCYTVEEAIKCDAHDHFISVVGYVLERYHQEPRFEREKFSVHTYGYGIPGSKIIAVVLTDTPPGSEAKHRVTCYLSWWQTLQYPLGLVPGSQVIVRFVNKTSPKVVTQDTQPYFRTSVLSVIDFLDLPGKKNMETDWGPRGVISQLPDPDLPDLCTWGTVSVSQLHTLTITASCRYCKHSFRNGTCGFVGCTATDPPVIYSCASFFLSEHLTSQVLVFVPDKFVRLLLGVSDETWSNLSLLAQHAGQLSYKRTAQQALQNLILEQKVFNAFCRNVMVGRRLHMLCRLTKRGSVENGCFGPSLYCSDLRPLTVNRVLEV